MMDQTDNGYYRCKIQHKTFYNECMSAYAKYITPEMLLTLKNNYSTKKLIPQSLCCNPRSKRERLFQISLAPNKIHVNFRHTHCWSLRLVDSIFYKFNILIDPNLARHLKMKDGNKGKSQVYEKTKEYTSGRSVNRYTKFAEAHCSQLDAQSMRVESR